MLERLQQLIEKGPFETDIVLHGPNVQVSKRARILSADHVGIVAQIKGGFGGGFGEDRAFPWSAVSAITLA